MSTKYYSGGGASSIGCSFSLLNLDNYFLGIDWGGGYDSPYSQPRYKGPLDCLFVSHAHYDHCGQVPRLVSNRGKTFRIFATSPTIDLCRIGWSQTLNLFKKRKQTASFTEQDVENTIPMMESIEYEQEIKLKDNLSVYPVNAGHILGSISLLVIYNKEIYFLTNDICFQDRSFVKGANKIELSKSKLLVRESTYIDKPFQNREEVIDDFVKKSFEIMNAGGRILVPALSIDRTQDLYAVAFRSRLASAFPVYIDGSKETTEIYAKHLGGNAEFLKSVMKFEGYPDRKQFLESGKPGMIIASSGMMHEGTASLYWAKNFAPNEKDAVFSVNYQDPEGQGAKFFKTPQDRFVVLGQGSRAQIVKRACALQSFNFSAHMSGDDGVAMEERLNPETVIYNHGQEYLMKRFIENSKSGRRRIQAKAGRWEEV